MRPLKTRGGLKHGRSITPATQAKAIHTLRVGIPICNYLEDFCNVHPQTFAQHYDLCPTTVKRNHQDINTLKTSLIIIHHLPMEERINEN